MRRNVLTSRARFLEYRFQRGQILRFRVSRNVEQILARPSGPLLRLLGKPFRETSESRREEWTLEVRVSDIRPDWTALCKTQVSEATYFVGDQETPFPKDKDPTTLYLNETVDRFGLLSDQQGHLPTPFLCLFQEEAAEPGAQWRRERNELLPVRGGVGGSGFRVTTVCYQSSLLAIAEVDGVELAEVSISAESVGEEQGAATYTLEGRVHFAIRDGHVFRAQVTRTQSTPVNGQILTERAVEKFRFEAAATEHTLGGMRV